MKQFVEDRGRAASPLSDAPNTKSRAVVGANAKVPVSHAGSNRQQQGQQNTVARRPATNQREEQRPQSVESRDGKRDRYDTDAESLDTTTHQRSVHQIHGNQRASHQQYTQEYEEDDTGSESESSEASRTEEIGREYDPGGPSEEHFKESLAMFRQMGAVGRDFLGDGNSYPSTTSGPGEESLNQWKTGEEQLSDDFSYGRGQSVRHQDHQAVAHSHKPSMSKRSDPIIKSAALREHQRSIGGLAVRGSGSYQRPAPALSTSQPPTYTQASRETVARADSVPKPKPHVQGNTLPTRSAWVAPSMTLAQPVRDIESAASGLRPGPAQLKEDPKRHLHPVEETSGEEIESALIEDYDRPALFQMTYDELLAESFDNVPRGQPQVLLGDMIQNPLEERLAHAHKHLNAGDQNKFFRSLRTRDWEDAGGWFVDQFTDIIQRTKEARQKKRKLARGFEDEVEKRYRHVAKRQQHVESALDKMKTRGQGLIPRTTRESKSPRKP